MKNQKLITIATIGVGILAIAAILVSTEKGREWREQLADAANDYGDEAMDKSKDFMEKFKNIQRKAKKTASDYIG